MTPDDALKKTGSFARGARIARVLHASPVKTSWLVERRGERFVLRVDRPLARRLALDRGAEFAVQRAAWRAGFAPEPIALVAGTSATPATHRAAGGTRRVPSAAILVTRYARGNAWQPADLREPRRLRRLAAMLRELHQARLPGPQLDLGAALLRYAAAAGTAEAHTLAERARRLLPFPDDSIAALCLCHNDAIPANIVGLRPSLLIDWEYAAIGDPLLDLAVATRHHRLPAPLVARFAASYYGTASRVPWRRLRQFGAFYEVLRRLWALAACTDGGAVTE